MAFIESPRFPDKIAYGSVGGPGFNTTVVVVDSGYESRNQNWTYPKCVYDVSHGAKTQDELKELIAFFRTVGKGRANSFRFKDYTDYVCIPSEGILDAGVGTGMPTYQMYKQYASESNTDTRPIKKPVSGTLSVFKNGVSVSFGASAGQMSIDTTTGVVTFVADATSSASSITVGATTTVVLAGNPGTLVSGKKLYLSGFTGADAALVNGIAHTVNSVSGSGPYTFILATNTAGKTITLGSGLGSKFPQASDTLAWSGEFDVPVRFDVDQMRVSIDDYNAYTWGQITIVEVRV